MPAKVQACGWLLFPSRVLQRLRLRVTRVCAWAEDAAGRAAIDNDNSAQSVWKESGRNGGRADSVKDVLQLGVRLTGGQTDGAARIEGPLRRRPACGRAGGLDGYRPSRFALARLAESKTAAAACTCAMLASCRTAPTSLQQSPTSCRLPRVPCMSAFARLLGCTHVRG